MPEDKKPCEQCFKIAGYEFVKTLGSGSFGAVYHVKRKDETFAMKQIEEKHGSLEAMKAFEEGLQTNHPHCISFSHAFWSKHSNTDVGHTFLFMELCSSRTLDDWIDSNRKKPNDPIVYMKKWIWQILSALECLNEKGVIHRDLKPNNVFFATKDDYTLGGTLKIGDFGMILRSISSNMTAGEYRQTYTQDGCYDYTAPEVLNGKSYNANADVYSLGIIAADLIHHLEFESFIKRNVTFRRGKFPDVLKKIPQPAKDFLKKATAPSKDRPLAKELIKHAFLSDCEVSDRVPDYKLIDTLHKLEDNHPLSENESQIQGAQTESEGKIVFEIVTLDGDDARSFFAEKMKHCHRIYKFDSSASGSEQKVASCLQELITTITLLNKKNRQIKSDVLKISLHRSK